MSDKYIWTNHVIQRLKDRKIPQNFVSKTVSNPDKTSSSNEGGLEYRKKFGNKTVHAIVKENERGERVILSCWINPPNEGTKDFKSKKRYWEMQKGSVWKKLW